MSHEGTCTILQVTTYLCLKQARIAPLYEDGQTTEYFISELAGSGIVSAEALAQHLPTFPLEGAFNAVE